MEVDHELSVKNMPSDALQIGDWIQDLDTTIDVGTETGDENVDFTARS